MNQLRMLLLTAVLVLSQTACAQDGSSDLGSHHLPIQKQDSASFETHGTNTEAIHSNSEIRVKIFPHNQEKYNAPQGADRVWERFSLKTAGSCSTYKADSDTSKNGGHSDKASASGPLLRFTAASLPYSVWVRCTQPAQLIRVGYEKKVIRYPGKFFIKKVIARNRAPYLTVVNVVTEQEYLKGVVPAEMPASWAPEALLVQAVAARTYFRYEIGSNVADRDPQLLIEKSGAQLDDTVFYQAYLGVYGQASTNAAVDQTENEVMTHNGQVIKAYFSADSGGHTENAENVWGVPLPYAAGKPELYPHGSVSISNWTSTRTFRDVQQRLLALRLITKTTPITGVSASSFYDFGRVKSVRIKFSDKTSLEVAGLDFQHAMGLRSNWFEITPTSTSITLRGRGFGHGVGMNQWGTRVLVADYKMNYQQILNFYYSGIKIVR